MAAERHLKLMPTILDREDGTIAREIAIDAPADLVFTYFTDPTKHVQWQGIDAELDVRPGGRLRVTFAPEFVAVGTYVDVDPPNRLTYSWGWEQGGSDMLPPGTSTVEITLHTTDRGTIVRLEHRGVPGPMIEFHSHGWDECLAELHHRLTESTAS